MQQLELLRTTSPHQLGLVHACARAGTHCCRCVLPCSVICNALRMHAGAAAAAGCVAAPAQTMACHGWQMREAQCEGACGACVRTYTCNALGSKMWQKLETIPEASVAAKLAVFRASSRW